MDARMAYLSVAIICFGMFSWKPLLAKPNSALMYLVSLNTFDNHVPSAA